MYELRDRLTTELDAGYIAVEEHNQLDIQADTAVKLINGYIRATRQRKLQGVT